MEKILGGILWLFILVSPFLSKYVYWKYAHRAMTLKHLLVDVLYFAFIWSYIPIISYVLLENMDNTSLQDVVSINLPDPYAYYVIQLIFILAILFPILVTFLYGYIYKRYFQQVNPYFALQIFICYLIIPYVPIILIGLIKDYL